MQDVTNCGNLLKPLIPSIMATYIDTCEKLQGMVKTQEIYGKSAAKVFMQYHKEQSSETKCTSAGNSSCIRYSPSKINTFGKYRKIKNLYEMYKFSSLTGRLYSDTARKSRKSYKFPIKIQQKQIQENINLFFSALD
jgi:hypothetical protein